jgi:DNA-binding FadR family transcriptional regulator
VPGADQPRFTSPLRVPKTAELIAAALRRQIVRGELDDGDVLPPETALMEQFAISRPTLREAFRVLESEALITVHRGSHGGARVHKPDIEVAGRFTGLVLQARGTTVADVLCAHALIGAQCARLLTERRTSGDLERLRLAAGGTDGQRESSSNFPHQFHALVVQLCGVDTMQVLEGLLRHVIERASVWKICADRGASDGPANRHAPDDSHRRLVEHVAAGDVDAAEDLWRRHLLDSTNDVTESSAGTATVELLF